MYIYVYIYVRIAIFHFFTLNSVSLASQLFIGYWRISLVQSAVFMLVPVALPGILSQQTRDILVSNTLFIY